MIKGGKVFSFNALQANCTVFWDNSGNCVVFDPSFSSEMERKQLYAFLKKEEIIPRGGTEIKKRDVLVMVKRK